MTGPKECYGFSREPAVDSKPLPSAQKQLLKEPHRTTVNFSPSKEFKPRKQDVNVYHFIYFISFRMLAS